MDKNFNWKYYLIFAICFATCATVLKWKIGVGFVLGTLAYFLNDKLLSKRFPSLETSEKAIGSMIGFLFLQGLVIIITAVACWFIGRLQCFLAGFAALILPTIYFLVIGIFKK